MFLFFWRTKKFNNKQDEIFVIWIADQNSGNAKINLYYGIY